MLSPETTPAHLNPTAPLRALVLKLHGGRTVADNVKRLRWKRRKAPVSDATPAQPSL